MFNHEYFLHGFIFEGRKRVNQIKTEALV